MMETEIWPNLLRACRESGVHTVLVNGRVSPRSYARYRRIRPLFRRVLQDVDRFCMQSEESARRMIDLGAARDRVTVTGSLKFDSLDWPGVGPHGQSRDRVLRFFRISDQRPVMIAASTLRGEDAAALSSFRRVKAAWPNALLIIAPRHPERFGEVTRLVAEEGFSVRRRTELPVDAEPHSDVIVLDTIGELARLYQIATVVFVGGSLVDAGGHNILEPAMFGKPIVFGPHMQNFAEIADVFLSHSAAMQVRGTRELEEAMLELLGDAVRRERLGAAARALVEANRGAKARTIAVIEQLLPSNEPRGGNVVRAFRLVR
jgi:3-deoxy-D-manno-octulosonic-acid transferase